MSNSGHLYSVHFETLCCRLNQDESEGAARSFSLHGFHADLEPVTARTALDEHTVLAVINTCTVTGKAEQKARRLIRLMLEKYPVAPVIVTGCYAELDAAEIASICPERIVILSGTQKFMLAALASEMQMRGCMSAQDLRSFLADRRSFCAVPSSASANVPVLNPFSLYTPVFEKHSRASIKIQDGCNCSCTFCRIHLARGMSVSLAVEDVVSRVQELERLGNHEVVCTGVNLSQYAGIGSDGSSYSFARLLDLLLKETEHIAFRISSFYPQSVSDELCAVIANPRVQPFFHLSIQSGSERILSLMKRPHSVKHVVRSIQKIRSAKDHPFISCDIIAGFPGETEDDFAMTQRLCIEQQFAWIHAFPFSPRPGTPAMDMRPQIPERIKGERVKWLSDMAVKGKIDYVSYWKGRTLSAIVENSRALRTKGMSADQINVIHCVTENFLHVECPLVSNTVPGSRVKVTITECLADSIIAGKEIDCRGVIV
ncbi:MAG: tRNA (N(6)-L-threonylcarbamoyladenosine(37)-C(2))-methylthiotransferase MtaB [Treponema sp.]|nr:tRNA (N(6)-L-threonylcarbamoyladenosine(37)-C(2))-methylthiotransferase MtaB [Treponema sp.]